MHRISVIVPALNEADTIGTLADVAELRDRGHEVIMVDGGSADHTVSIAEPLVDRVLIVSRGRGRQMNAGADAAQGSVLLFLHADTRLPDLADRHILHAMVNSGRCWGRFDVRLSGSQPLLRVVEWLMNLRSRLTGIATGDQAIFVCRSAFEAVGGFPEIELMEDIVLSSRLKRLGPPLCLWQRVLTSSRRWERYGTFSTITRMSVLRLAFALGIKPSILAQYYD